LRVTASEVERAQSGRGRASRAQRAGQTVLPGHRVGPRRERLLVVARGLGVSAERERDARQIGVHERRIGGRSQRGVKDLARFAHLPTILEQNAVLVQGPRVRGIELERAPTGEHGRLALASGPQRDRQIRMPIGRDGLGGERFAICLDRSGRRAAAELRVAERRGRARTAGRQPQRLLQIDERAARFAAFQGQNPTQIEQCVRQRPARARAELRGTLQRVLRVREAARVEVDARALQELRERNFFHAL
jgi:hypothetical protein